MASAIRESHCMVLPQSEENSRFTVQIYHSDGDA